MNLTAEDQEQVVLPLEGDQALPEEQTQGDLPVVAAAPPEEAAPEEKPLTQADFDRKWQEREAQLRRDAVEEARDLERRQRQSQEGQKAAEARRQAQLRDAVQVSLGKRLGVLDVDDETADEIIARVRGVEASVVEQSTEAAINEAIAVAAAQVVGLRTEDVSADAQRYIGRFRAYMERLLSHQAVRDFVTQDAKKQWEADLPKILDAERAKNGAPKPPIKRIEGDPVALDTSREARLNRLAYGHPTEDDRKWHRDTYGHI